MRVFSATAAGNGIAKMVWGAACEYTPKPWQELHLRIKSNNSLVAEALYHCYAVPLHSMAKSKYNVSMFRKRAKKIAADEKAEKPVSIYGNLDYARALKEEHASERISTDVNTLILYADYRHGVARSFYLVPPGIKVVHLYIEDNDHRPKKVEFLNNSFHTLHSAETTDSGVLLIEVGSFLNGCCYLRMENLRLICLSIDKWPYFLPPFLNPNANNGTTNIKR